MRGRNQSENRKKKRSEYDENSMVFAIVKEFTFGKKSRNPTVIAQIPLDEFGAFAAEMRHWRIRIVDDIPSC